jgi:hypothetical protein
MNLKYYGFLNNCLFKLFKIFIFYSFLFTDFCIILPDFYFIYTFLQKFRGVLRWPIFHTCSYMIELPDTYRNYDDLKQELLRNIRKIYGTSKHI